MSDSTIYGMAGRSWPDDETPTPDLVAAWFVLNRVPVKRVPWWAAEWLARGHDGPALRELAGLGAHDSHAVHDLLPDALAEANATVPSDRVAAAFVWFLHVACVYVDGHMDERWVARVIDEVVRATDYDHGVYESPLGSLYGVDDAWTGGWGPNETELRAMVQVACRQQIEDRLP